MIDLEQVFDGNSNNARLKDLSLYLSLYEMVKALELLHLLEAENEPYNILKH